jgi:osmoprotectant transport system substrate-binding protein
MQVKPYQVVVLLIVTVFALAACAGAPAATPAPAAPVATSAPAAPAATQPTAATTAVTSTTAASGSLPGSAAQTGAVRIGSKDFTEELLLGEMYAQLLGANNIPVERKLNLAGTQVAHDALTSNQIDMYPEYTGTAYGFILGIKDNEKDPAKVYQAVTSQYKTKWNFTWLEPAPMNDTNAIACTQAVVTKYNLKTLSDLSKAAPNINFAAIPDFPQRPDGLAGLKQLYGGFDFKSMNIYDPGLKYKAVTDGKADCAISFSTDGQISAYKLVLMQDDKGLWPPYQVSPVVRQATLDKYPQMAAILNKLAPVITNDVISGLNWKVDGDKQEYTQVAKDFLTSKGLIK